MSDESRLRPPPSERFAGSSHLFSLSNALEELRAEDHPSRSGHRQITLLQRAPVTQVLFSFDAGGHLNQHSAPGLVTIHVLEGKLSVKADKEEHDLVAGDVLVLDPDVPHDVRASEVAAMLLTVHLRQGDG